MPLGMLYNIEVKPGQLEIENKAMKSAETYFESIYG
jgi:hypothetical protein